MVKVAADWRLILLSTNVAAVYENELKRFWPVNEKHRQEEIAQFAKKYGFRLRFYCEGFCAIFNKEPPIRNGKVKNNADNVIEIDFKEC